MMRIALSLLALLLSYGVADAAPKKRHVAEPFSCHQLQEPMEWMSFGVQLAIDPKAAIAWKVGGMLIEELIPDRQFKDGLWFVLDPIGGSLNEWMKNTKTREEWETACWIKTIWSGYRMAQDIKGLRGGGGAAMPKARHYKHHRHHHRHRHHHHWRHKHGGRPWKQRVHRRH